MGVIDFFHCFGYKTFDSVGTVNGGYVNFAAESFEFFFIEDLVFGVEAEDNGNFLSLFAKFFCKHIKRRNTNAAADK